MYTHTHIHTHSTHAYTHTLHTRTHMRKHTGRAAIERNDWNMAKIDHCFFEEYLTVLHSVGSLAQAGELLEMTFGTNETDIEFYKVFFVFGF